LHALFVDLATRSTENPDANESSIDRLTFCEYINMPGILRERIFKLVRSKDNRVYEAKFNLI